MNYTTTWRALYGVTLTLMLFASSSQPALQDLSYYLRFAALAALAVTSYRWHPPQSITVKQMSTPGRLLINGMALAVGVAIASCLWSVDPLVTAQQAVALAAVAGIVHALLSRRWVSGGLIAGDLAAGFWTIVAFLAAGLVGLAAGLPHMQSSYDGQAITDMRFQGLAGNPNMLAVLCVPVIPLAWYLFREQGRCRFLGGGGVAVVSMLMSQSRTALLAVAVGAIITMLRRGPRAVSTFVVVGGAAAGCAYVTGLTQWMSRSGLYTNLVDRFGSDAGGGSLNGRPEVWAECVRLLWERPSLGYGYAAGPSLFHQLIAGNDLSIIVDVAHSSYLQWMLETGVVGLPALGFLIAACVAAAIHASRSRSGSGLAWLTVAGLIMQVTESAMLGIGQAYPYIFWAGVAGAAAHRQAGRNLQRVLPEPSFTPSGQQRPVRPTR